MYVRLAFSVAAHMEPDILIIDEVLAVGDAEFQKKCLGKMDEITKKDGRTILFVSHNMESIKNLCTKTILLKNGQIISYGTTEKVISNYISSPKKNEITTASLQDRLNRTSGATQFSKIKCIREGNKENESWTFKYNQDINFKIECKINEQIKDLMFVLYLKDIETDKPITNIEYVIDNKVLLKGNSVAFIITIPKETIRKGQYKTYFWLGNLDGSIAYDVIDENSHIPFLMIQSINANENENSGFFSVPFSAKILHGETKI